MIDPSAAVYEAGVNVAQGITSLRAFAAQVDALTDSSLAENKAKAQIVANWTMPPTSVEALRRLSAVQDVLLSAEQIAIRTEHVLHGGMYARTIRLEAGVVITGALIKVPTVLIVEGACSVLVNNGWAELDGYNIVAASAGRKQIFVTRGPVAITMIFATKARTVAEAEAEFTDEAELLMSRHADGDLVTITGG